MPSLRCNSRQLPRARHQRGGGPANIAWLDSKGIGFSEIDLDLDLGNLNLELSIQIDKSIDSRELTLNFSRQTAKNFQIGAVDADDDGFACACQDFLNSLLKVGLDIASESRIAFNSFLNRRDSRIVIDVRVDADPVFGEIDPNNFVGDQRASYVSAEVAEPGNRA